MSNPTTRREHTGGASPATLTTSMSAADLAFSIDTNTGWPSGGVGPFYVVMDPGTFSEEKILCASRSSLVVTVASGGRGADGTTARTHAIGAVVYPCWTAAEADELNLHAASTSGVHNVTGAVVGTTDSQTLTNKTISTANNTLTGVQPLNANLTSVSGLSAVGLVAQSNTGTFVGRTIVAASSMVTVNNGGGLVSNPSIDVNPANFTGIPSTGVTQPVPNLLVYTASTSLALSSVVGAKALRVRIRAGGGAGGGCPLTGAGQIAVGSGGGQGAWSESVLDMAALTFPVTITIPIAAVGSVGAAGANGGDCSFGTYAMAKGGVGGAVAAANAGTGFVTTGGAGGAAGSSIGQYVESGAPGSAGFSFGGLYTVPAAGGGCGTAFPINYNSTPQTPSILGAGGHGAANLASQGSARIGGSAQVGLMVIEPIY